MTSAATATLALQWTPPNAAVNSGSVCYPVVANYNAQNVGQFDLMSTETLPVTNTIPFGSITQCLMLVIKNGQATDIGVKINGGVQLAGAAASITYNSVGTVNTISGLTGMTSAMVGATIQIGGATTVGNNGSYVIVTVTNSSTVTVVNASGATDANNGHIFWVLDMTLDNFKVPPGGVLMYAAPVSPGNPAMYNGTTPVPPVSFISSCTVTSYGLPVVGNVEQISYFTFGN